MKAVVDTGAVALVLPQDVVEKLQLDEIGRVTVQYAVERKDIRPVAGPIRLTILDRAMIADCIVGPPESEALIGQVVLERLDLLADCTEQRLMPRPGSEIYPLLKLK